MKLILLALAVLVGGCVATTVAFTTVEVVAHIEKNQSIVDIKRDMPTVWKGVLDELKARDVDTKGFPEVDKTGAHFSVGEGYVAVEPHKSYPKEYTRLGTKWKNMKGGNRDVAVEFANAVVARVGGGAPEE
ncbi:MAG: hypothetical protein ACYTGK_14260 [Planctomycetota bacterium]|jgi:hypothetical protein